MEEVPENCHENIQNLQLCSNASQCEQFYPTWPPVSNAVDNELCCTDNLSTEQHADFDMNANFYLDNFAQLLMASPSNEKRTFPTPEEAELLEELAQCMNPTYACDCARVTGYQYCQKHIHLDPYAADFKQCEYVYSYLPCSATVHLDKRRTSSDAQEEQKTGNEVRCTEFLKARPYQCVVVSPHFCATHLLEWEAAILREKHASHIDGTAVGFINKLRKIKESLEKDDELQSKIDCEGQLKHDVDKSLMAERIGGISERAVYVEPSTSKKKIQYTADAALSVGTSDPLATAGIYTPKELLRDFMRKQEELIVLYKNQESLALSQMEKRTKKKECEDKAKIVAEQNGCVKDMNAEIDKEREVDVKPEDAEASKDVTESYEKQNKQTPSQRRIRLTREQKLTLNTLQEITEMHESLLNGCEVPRVQCKADASCKNPLFWPSNCCLNHVLYDERQRIFLPCGKVIDGIECQNPIIPLGRDSQRCQFHAKKPKFMREADSDVPKPQDNDNQEKVERESNECDNEENVESGNDDEDHDGLVMDM